MRCCIITTETVGPFKNGGIGTHCYHLARWLAEQGHDVHILYTGPVEIHDVAWWTNHYRKQWNVGFTKVPGTDGAMPVRTSAEVLACLREMPAFDVCFFQEMCGTGFHALQAARLEPLFDRTLMTCMVHSSWEWINQSMRVFPSFQEAEAISKYMERYCVQHSDVLLSPSRYMLDWCAANDYKSDSPSYVLPYLLDGTLEPCGSRPVADKLIFFGRLEVRKGIMLMVEALRLLNARLAARGRTSENPVTVYFLGREGYIPGGGSPTEMLQALNQELVCLHIEPITTYGHEEALNFLRDNNDAAVVCPSLTDNLPNTVIEAAHMGLNIVAARSGGIPEILGESARLFDPEPEALADTLESALDNDLPEHKPLWTLANAEAIWAKFMKQDVHRLLSEKRAVEPAPAPTKAPPFTVYCRADHARLKTLNDADYWGGSAPEKIIAVGPEKVSLPTGGIGVEQVAHLSKVDPAAGEFAVVLTHDALVNSERLPELVNAMKRAQLDTATGWVTMPETYDDLMVWENTYHPVGADFEDSIYCNFLGEGILLIDHSQMEGACPAIDDLLRRNSLWPFLLERAATNPDRHDVLGQVIGSGSLNTATVNPTEPDFEGHFQALSKASATVPKWALRTLIRAIEKDRHLAQERARSHAQTQRANQAEAQLQQLSQQPAALQPQEQSSTETATKPKRPGFFKRLSNSTHKRILNFLYKHYDRDYQIGDLFPDIDKEFAPHKHLFKGKVLNAGAGHRDISYMVDGELFNQDIPEGLHNDNIHIYSPLHDIPKPDGFFDFIICNAVMEHVRNPHEVMNEFYRVMKPGGRLLLTVPFMQPEHCDPADFQRYTVDGLQQLCKDHGLTIECAEALHSVYTTMGWIIYHLDDNKRSYGNFFLRAVVMRHVWKRALRSSRQVHQLASAYRVIARRPLPGEALPS